MIYIINAAAHEKARNAAGKTLNRGLLIARRLCGAAHAPPNRTCGENSPFSKKERANFSLRQKSAKAKNFARNSCGCHFLLPIRNTPKYGGMGSLYLGVFIYFIGKTVFSHEVATAAVAL